MESVKQIIRTAKDRRAGSLGFAEVLLMNYNRKMQTHCSLPMEKLYTHKIKTKDEVQTDIEEEEIEMPADNSPETADYENQISLSFDNTSEKNPN